MDRQVPRKLESDSPTGKPTLPDHHGLREQASLIRGVVTQRRKIWNKQLKAYKNELAFGSLGATPPGPHDVRLQIRG
ncbi:hypothetical protein J6590_042307 [Homalodisca vitripennis]|nr:hypothetical protein J6590_042307 [Homalodisca vitripennis]